MRVLHVIDSLGIGGSERMLVDLANASLGAGLAPSVCATRLGGSMQKELDPRIPCSVLGRRGRLDLRRGLQFAAIVRQRRAQVLHVHGRYSLLYVATLRALGLLRCPIVFHDHWGNLDTDPSVPRWFPAVARRHVAAYVGVSRGLAEWAVAAGMPAERATSINNAVDLDRLLRAPPATDPARNGRRRGIAVAGWRKEKGLHVLIDAARALGAPATAELLIVGGSREPGYLEGCRAASASGELARLFRFLGERSDAPSLVRAVEFGVVPSLTESGPLVLIEYLACGLPVAATRSGEIARIALEAGVPGLVTPGDVEALAAELDRILSASEAELRERGEIAADVTRRHFSIQAVLPQWIETYRRVTAA
jgi:glycosyltransferase involved in cell wall biosynthesis